MRIIAGCARGRTLRAPKGSDTRPTQDYVRESLFNILMRDVPDAEVLDLFAGSGALALEALSRGAANAVFCDVSPEAVACIRANTEALRLTERVTILRADWADALNRLAGEKRAFTLVFLDPPYRMTDTAAQCARMADLGLLAAGALIVIEHDRNGVPAPDVRFTLRDGRRYGDTEIHFFIYQGGEPAHV
jgi:16S rRNA (guanine966-N2)-methyltransferase